MPAQQHEMTSIYDEDVFKILMEYEIKRSQRYASPISLLRIKLISGHSDLTDSQSPSAALAIMLNTRLRKADIPSKIGNEVFVLLPATDETSARAVCSRMLRVTHGTFTAPLGFTSPLSICIGLASHPGGEGLSAERLMQEAELALREARAHGAQTYSTFSDTLKSQTRPVQYPPTK